MPIELTPRLQHVASVISTPPLRDYLAGRMLASTGGWVFRVSAGWFVWSQTQSPAMLGIATMLLLAPQIILSPLSGVMADRRDRRTVLAASSVLSGTLILAVAALVIFDQLSVPGFLSAVVLVGAAGGFAQASSKTIVSSFVVENDLATAVSLNSVVFNLAGFVGPALAGIVISLHGVSFGFLLSAVLSFGFVLSLARVPRMPPEVRSKSGTFLSDIKVALAAVVNDRLLGTLFLFHLASATLARPFMEFIPAIIGQIFSGGATQVAMMTSMVGIGSIIGGLWLAQRDNRQGMLPVVLGAMLGLALILVAVVWSPFFPLTLMLCLIAGFAMITRAAAIQTILQIESPDGMRGRIVSFYALVLDTGSILGAIIIGLFAEFMGIRLALTLSVSGAVIVWLALRDRLLSAMRDRPGRHGARDSVGDPS